MEAALTYETVTVELRGSVTLITLNRPQALNALNSTVLDDLISVFSAYEADPGQCCAVLTGSGDKAFAAGADIKEMADKPAADFYLDDFFAPWTSEIVKKTRKPWIAAVNGFALGGGCELAMMCDFIICADNAKFGQPEINLGVVAGIGGTQRLTRFVGKSKAMDMHLTGRFMEAAEAERSGLVSRVVPAAKLMTEAMSAARKIAEKSSLTAMVVKEAVDRSYETTLREGILFERRIFHALFATEDQKEGMNAFLEKREPQFRDK